MHHEMLLWVTVVTINGKTGRQNLGGWEFFYISQDHPKREDLEFSAVLYMSIFFLKIDHSSWMLIIFGKWDWHKRQWRMAMHFSGPSSHQWLKWFWNCGWQKARILKRCGEAFQWVCNRLQETRRNMGTYRLPYHSRETGELLWYCCQQLQEKTLILSSFQQRAIGIVLISGHQWSL